MVVDLDRWDNDVWAWDVGRCLWVGDELGFLGRGNRLCGNQFAVDLNAWNNVIRGNRLVLGRDSFIQFQRLTGLTGAAIIFIQIWAPVMDRVQRLSRSDSRAGSDEAALVAVRGQ